MGVVTNAYSISAEQVEKIQQDNELIAEIFDGDSQPSSFDFDTTVDAWISVLHAAGYENTATNIDSGNAELGEMEYESYDLWLTSADQVKAMAQEIQGATFAQLVSSGLAAGVSDRRGTKLDESEYAGYFEDGIEKLKTFLSDAAKKGHSLIFAEA